VSLPHGIKQKIQFGNLSDEVAFFLFARGQQ